MTTSKRSSPPTRSRETGGFAMGLIVGLLIGLALALGVALYVAKVPSPFVNKVPQRTADQDAAEAEKNRHWDPNTPLYGKNPARPNSAAASGVVAAPFAGGPSSAPVVSGATTPGAVPGSAVRDPAAILADRPVARPASSGSDGAVVTTTRSGAYDPFSYFLQVGAYARAEDAEEQRARVALMGFTAKVYEREQSGRTVFRVRVGPYEKKDDADVAKDKLDGAAVESALVRVQK